MLFWIIIAVTLAVVTPIGINEVVNKYGNPWEVFFACLTVVLFELVAVVWLLSVIPPASSDVVDVQKETRTIVEPGVSEVLDEDGVSMLQYFYADTSGAVRTDTARKIDSSGSGTGKVTVTTLKMGNEMLIPWSTKTEYKYEFKD